MSDILNHLLTFQNQMKLYHWQTNSYARHKGSDKFVAKAIEIIDKIIEAYQGRYGVIKLKNSNKNVKLDNINDEDIVKFLEKMREFMEKDFTNALNNKNTDLYNLRDEMIENINITLYLFHLK